MATHIFKSITVGALTEASSFPYDITDLNVRGLAVLASAGSGVISLTFKDGTTLDTPRMTLGTPYRALFEKEIHAISSVGSLTAFDIELLKQGEA